MSHPPIAIVPTSINSLEQWNRFIATDEFKKIQQFFGTQLVQWFKAKGRDLPWRRTRDPYKILLSEIMLQQTQVNRVKEFYHRFLKQLPDFKSLATASEETVIELWGGLGYYNRARNLQKTAQIIMQDYHGQFPTDHADILDLPGIGEYTAGAVMTFALNLRAPLVDTNVERVYARLFLQDITISSPSEKAKIFWMIAEKLLPFSEYWEFNQGIMDFGAFLCKLPRPVCQQCPFSQFCRYYSRRSLKRFFYNHS